MKALVAVFLVAGIASLIGSVAGKILTGNYDLPLLIMGYGNMILGFIEMRDSS